ncbi:MAG TPA: LysM peptidoglycan-binding domain-containing protein [Steroidobacteraceae bacterium]|nr:LysM peptidoglycan-binding domain-containing protein [Steroidobacteraceae bacterium]
MSSTHVNARIRGCERWWIALFAACALALVPFGAVADDAAFPQPAALQRDVDFWIRVYSQIDTNSGFLHDENNLAVVYDTLHFAPATSPRAREHEVEAARDHVIAALKRIATAEVPLAPEDQHIHDLWGDQATPIRLLEATNHIRFQLGQADRFREGLRRSGKWETHIAETLANLGLPPELAVLPHVESSFNPAAYSKVGAAGLWQFMRSTGRRYMRIDATVDDRLDPFRATEAAAQLLSYNYRLLGTWPLALTAYNHGAAGVRRAKETLGTDDIAQIVRNYKSPSFGFASRNFYVSFLAALEIDRNPDKYFGQFERAEEAKFQELILPARTSITQLERALNIDLDTLRVLNPALRPACWRGSRPVPNGYHLRLPMSGHWTEEVLARRLGIPATLVAAEIQPKHRVLPGETLASIAEDYRVSTSTLAHMNNFPIKARLHVGSYVRVPETPVGLLRVATRSAPSTSPQQPAAAPVAVAASGSRLAAASLPLVAASTRTPAAQAIAQQDGGGSAESSLSESAPPGVTTTFDTPSAAPVSASAPARATLASSPLPVSFPSTSAAAATTGVATPPASATPATALTALGTSVPGPAVASTESESSPAAKVYVVQSGDSLSEIATKVGMAAPKLLELNHIRDPDYIFEGQRLVLVDGGASAEGADGSAAAAEGAQRVPPALASSSAVARTREPASGAAQPPAAGGVTAEVAERESEEDATAIANTPVAKAEPVSAAQAEALGPALGPAAVETVDNADPIDYSVSKDGTIVVAAAETIGHYADWLDLPASRLRAANHMRYGRPVVMGRKVRLDFVKVSRDVFEGRRREYHRALEASYFAAHRITGTDIYIARRGDSLWTVTLRYEHLPIWLLQQYNPDVDFAEMRPGTQIVVPRIEDVVNAPGDVNG